MNQSDANLLMVKFMFLDSFSFGFKFFENVNTILNYKKLLLCKKLNSEQIVKRIQITMINLDCRGCLFYIYLIFKSYKVKTEFH